MTETTTPAPETLPRAYERQLLADIKSRVDGQVEELATRRWWLLRSLQTPAARLVFEYFRPKLRVLSVLTGLNVASTALEAVRLLFFVVLLKLIVGDTSEAGSAVGVFGFNLDLPFVSDLTGRRGLAIALAAFGLATLAKEALDFGLNYLAYRLQSVFMFELRRDLLDKLLKLESRYFTDAKLGDIAYLQNTIVGRFAGLVPTVRSLMQSVLDVGVVVAILALLSEYMTLVLAGVALALFLLTSRLGRRARRLSFASEEASRLASTQFLEMVHGIRLVKLGGQEGRSRGRYLNLAWDSVLAVIRLANYQGIATAVTRVGGVAALLVLALMLSIVSGFAPDKNVGIGLAFLYIAYRAITSVGMIIDNRLRLSTMVPHILMVADFLLDPSYVESSAERSLPQLGPVRERLAAERVRFSYVPPRRVLDDVTLEFPLGTITALVGPSGSGKTTLLELLAGFRTPDSGSILVDGKDLAAHDAPSYRAQIGYVTQDTVIFHDTMLENLRFLRPEATREEIERALDAAVATEFVAETEKGFDTVVGERGLKVSGGQRQRIALARVLLQDAPVLLLDEATNALDLETEARIYDNLLGMKENRITVVAAHRLSAITRFDNIVVMHHGRVVEEGTHAALMAARGFYYHLYGLQQFEPEADVGELAEL